MDNKKTEQSADCKSTLKIKHCSLEKPHPSSSEGLKKDSKGSKRSKRLKNTKSTKKAKKTRKNSRLKKIFGKIKHIICSIKPFVKSHKDGFCRIGIAALAAAMVFQSGFLWTRMLDRGSTPRGTPAHSAVRWLEHTDKKRSNITEPAAYPVKLAVRTSIGLYGIQYSADGVKTAWEQTADIWGQAFSALRNVKPVSKTDYISALQKPMMFAEFDGSVPLTLIAGWTGSDISQNISYINCGGMLLSRDDEDTYNMYFRSSDTQLIYCAATTLTDADFDSAAVSFSPNGCTLASDTQTLVFPDTLQFSQPQSFDTVTIQPYTGSMSGLLEAFDMDGQSAQETAYSSQDATVIYVGDKTSVKVTPADVMTYTSQDGIDAYTGSLNQAGREQKCVQLGYNIASDMLEAMGSGGNAYLTKAYTDKNGRYITVFSMYIDGVPVDNELGYFLRCEFDGNRLIRADALLRVCTVTGTAVTVMPEKIAAASRNDGTALLSLRYTDTFTVFPNKKPTANTEGSVSDGYQRTDDSWVDAPDNYNSPTDGTIQDNPDGTAADYNSSMGSTLNGTGDTVSAEAEWKFILYSFVEQSKPAKQEVPDLTICHMPDFLIPISGGADR